MAWRCSIALALSACKKASKSSQSDDTPDAPFGTAPAKKTDGGGGTSPSTRPALPTGWREFKHPDGAYTISVPAAPIRDPMSPASLNLKQPLKALEARESTYGVNPTAAQPLLCKMEVTVFDAGLQSTLEQSMLQIPPKGNIHMKVQSYRTVKWAGLNAKEAIVEQTYSKGPNEAPLRYSQVMRFAFAPGRLYMFTIGRENQAANKRRTRRVLRLVRAGGMSNSRKTYSPHSRYRYSKSYTVTAIPAAIRFSSISGSIFDHSPPARPQPIRGMWTDALSSRAFFATCSRHCATAS